MSSRDESSSRSKRTHKDDSGEDEYYEEKGEDEEGPQEPNPHPHPSTTLPPISDMFPSLFPPFSSSHMPNYHPTQLPPPSLFLYPRSPHPTSHSTSPPFFSPANTSSLFSQNQSLTPPLMRSSSNPNPPLLETNTSPSPQIALQHSFTFPTSSNTPTFHSHPPQFDHVGHSRTLYYPPSFTSSPPPQQQPPPPKHPSHSYHSKSSIQQQIPPPLDQTESHSDRGGGGTGFTTERSTPSENKGTGNNCTWGDGCSLCLKGPPPCLSIPNPTWSSILQVVLYTLLHHYYYTQRQKKHSTPYFPQGSSLSSGTTLDEYSVSTNILSGPRYFGLQEDIYPFVQTHWNALGLNKKQSQVHSSNTTSSESPPTQTLEKSPSSSREGAVAPPPKEVSSQSSMASGTVLWQKQLLDGLSHNRGVFRSGHNELGKSGYWSLEVIDDPWALDFGKNRPKTFKFHEVKPTTPQTSTLSSGSVRSGRRGSSSPPPPLLSTARGGRKGTKIPFVDPNPTNETPSTSPR